MFIKSLTVAAVAAIATVSAQTVAVPNHTYFTAPVGDGVSFTAGKNSTFSWMATCVPPSDMTALDPTKAVVQLVDSTNGGNAAFLVDITTIDCTQPSGNVYWTPPATFPDVTKFALRINLATPQYSGNFIIKSATPPASTAPATTSPTPVSKSAGSMVTPVLAGAATIASAALLFL
ncbi:hypothetical protein BGZ52_005028 [Haplosporangium bisporale]|nr:hypothetical protein BGZ52_005028 [Haplosporangium bisporale]KAF9216078.1 hypothetical protein BGZ59_011088 [Podila verticillata]KFH71713.1 hypothetical protein MVEG_02008 [Podila verticillata NRRL 6337]